MAILRLLTLLFAVSTTHVSSSPLASHGLQQGRGVAVQDDDVTDSPVRLPPTKIPVLPVVTEVTATFKTTLVLTPRNTPAPLVEEAAAPAEAVRGCTTTYTPPFLPHEACKWSGTLTLYPTTVVMNKEIDCNGCDTLYISDYWYLCPNMRINKTERADTASTWWNTICRPTPARLRRDGEAQNAIPATATSNGQVVVGTPQPISNPATTALPRPSTLPGVQDLRIRQGEPDACPTTYVVQPEQSAGKTSTKYSKTTTSTSLLNCSGCSLVISTAVAGYGPPVVFTTTTTLPVGTVTAYACK